jgi:hypothetical protein
MKNIILLLVAVILTTSACKKNFLDVAPRDQLSSETFWKTANDANQASVGVYSSWSSNHRYQLWFADNWSDNTQTSGFWDGYYYNTWANGNITAAAGDLDGFWSSLYNVIRKTNVFSANINQPIMDETQRKTLTAEVRFIRAFEYFYLYQTWGEVPLVDKPLSASELKVSRANAGETIKFMLADLDYAIENLNATVAQEGRITKGAALGLKARILLYEGRWEESAAAAKQVMDLNVYQLFRNTNGDGYSQLFTTQNENSKESMLDWEFVQTDRVTDLQDLMYYASAGDALVSPTSSLVDSYDGYNKNTDMLVAVDPNNRFLNRDPRLDFTVAHIGSVFNGKTLAASDLSTHSSGYGVAKYLTPELYTSRPNGIGTNYMLMRYAEILLTYAEAKIKANQIDQTVVDAINDVRSRAYGTLPADVTHYPEVSLGTPSAMLNIVLKERRVELAGEGLRWFDIKRLKAINLMPANKGLTDKNYIRPIPQNQIDLMGRDVLSQNPGYN